MEKEFKLVKLLGRCSDEGQQMCMNLVKIFEEKNSVSLLIKTLTTEEIEETSKRIEGIFSKLMTR